MLVSQSVVLQSCHEGKGSLEQPPRCASWRLRFTEQFYVAQPGWQHYEWPSCAFGLCDPVSGEHWKNMQCFCCAMLSWDLWHAPHVGV